MYVITLGQQTYYVNEEMKFKVEAFKHFLSVVNIMKQQKHPAIYARSCFTLALTMTACSLHLLSKQ